jgi:hypothetical protein
VCVCVCDINMKIRRDSRKAQRTADGEVRDELRALDLRFDVGGLEQRHHERHRALLQKRSPRFVRHCDRVSITLHTVFVVTVVKTSVRRRASQQTDRFRRC